MVLIGLLDCPPDYLSHNTNKNIQIQNYCLLNPQNVACLSKQINEKLDTNYSSSH